MKFSQKEKIAVLGAGSGLGLELVKKLKTESGLEVGVWSRHWASELEGSSSIDFFKSDFSQSQNWSAYAAQLVDWSPDRWIYCAGGGPYGRYEEKKWEAHEWAFKVNFLFPSFLMHQMLKEKAFKQALFIGSSIAENHVDPGATSYSASKHALRGLILNLINENNDLDIRLFSPGYMKSKMLPPQSEPVLNGSAREPGQVAIEIIDWMLTPKAITQAHIVSR